MAFSTMYIRNLLAVEYVGCVNFKLETAKNRYKYWHVMTIYDRLRVQRIQGPKGHQG